MRPMPQLIPGQRSIKMTSVFRGYNHNNIIADGEMFNMTNLCGDKYPLLSPRKKRGISTWDAQGQTPVPLTGIHGRDQLVMIRGTQVIYNFTAVSGLTVSDSQSMLPKQIISFGAYVLIWPDKVYFNTIDLEDYGSMERIFPGENSNITGADVQVNMCRVDGTDYDTAGMTIAADPPSDPVNGEYWIDQSGPNDILKYWYSPTEEWIEVGTTYLKIQCTGIGQGIKEYDAVTISGFEAAGEVDARIYQEIEDLNGTKIVYGCGDNYIIVVGLLNTSQAALEDQEIHIDRKIPALDFICESNNRLWGCFYGMDGEGNFINEIRASKLGDFRNWNCFMGLSTDSYSANVGTDGEWTGAVTQRGYPVFFKENCIHRVSGSQPTNYQVQTTIARGVQRLSDRSIAVVAENIYYKARDAVMVYDGNMPEPISEQLGEVLYSEARAGALHEKYFISMLDDQGVWNLFVFDTKHNTWHRQDNTQVLGFGTVDDELYFIDEQNNTLVTVTGTLVSDSPEQSALESDFDWMAEFDLFGTTYISSSAYDDPKRVRNSKYLSMFKIRAALASGAYMRLYIKYDDNENWEYIGEKTGTDMRTFVLPVVPKRCDHIRFKLAGHGTALVYDISRILEVGGDGV